MLLKQIIGAIRKLIGFGNVGDAEIEKQRLERLVAEGFRPGSASPVEEVRQAFFRLVELDCASTPETPARPGSDKGITPPAAYKPLSRPDRRAEMKALKTKITSRFTSTRPSKKPAGSPPKPIR